MEQTKVRCGECGASRACWICLGAGRLKACAARGIDHGDSCHGCSGTGVQKCRPCANKLLRSATQAVSRERQVTKLGRTA